MKSDTYWTDPFEDELEASGDYEHVVAIEITRLGRLVVAIRMVGMVCLSLVLATVGLAAWTTTIETGINRVHYAQTILVMGLFTILVIAVFDQIRREAQATFEEIETALAREAARRNATTDDVIDEKLALRVRLVSRSYLNSRSLPLLTGVSGPGIYAAALSIAIFWSLASSR